MGRTQDPGGDYGYDEVHQNLRPTRGRPADGGDEPAPERPQDTAGDYGYDEAHDF